MTKKRILEICYRQRDLRAGKYLDTVKKEEYVQRNLLFVYT